MRRRTALLIAAALVAPAVPSLATTPTTVVQPVVRIAQLPADGLQRLTGGDRLVGVTWEAGSPTVETRWHTAAGWTAWTEAHDDSDVPEAAERAGAVRGTEPVWRPAGADLVQVRVDGAAQGVKLVSVADGVATRTRTRAAHAGGGRALLGDVGSRADWGADESIRDRDVDYADRVDAVVVHHTVQANDYSPADVPALIRADYAYHVKARRWGDLGYNLLVDRFGGIWEGRAGGLRRAVVGAHAQGFNTRTLGVALLGDMSTERPTTETVKALARVAAYAGATWRFDPRESVTLTSRGSPRYPSGRRVTLGRVFGHQETGQTACPGTLQGRLPDVRAGGATLLGPRPRITDVEVTGAPVHAPAPLDIRAPLTRESTWTGAIRDGRGRVVHEVSGESGEIALQWNGLVPVVGDTAVLPAEPGTYTWAIQVDNGYHRPDRRTGTVDVGLPVLPVG